MSAFMFYLVLLMANTEQPVLIFIEAHETAASCLDVLEKVPKNNERKFACIEISMTPVRNAWEDKI